MNRRDFLIRTTALGTIATLNQVAMLSARPLTASQSRRSSACSCSAATTKQYRHSLQRGLRRLRGSVHARAAAGEPRSAAARQRRRTGALHPDLAPLASIWNAGNLAVLFQRRNALRVPSPRSDLAHSVPRPENLMSHADQQQQWMSGIYRDGRAPARARGLRSARCQRRRRFAVRHLDRRKSAFHDGQASQPLSCPRVEPSALPRPARAGMRCSISSGSIAATPCSMRRRQFCERRPVR